MEFDYTSLPEDLIVEILKTVNVNDLTNLCVS